MSNENINDVMSMLHNHANRIEQSKSIFTLAISNPPYLGSNQGVNDIPYVHLYKLSRLISQNTVMICPNKWRFFGMNKNDYMKNDKGIAIIDDYYEQTSSPVILFPMAITHGVNIIFASNDYDNNTDGIIIKLYNTIIDKHRNSKYITWNDNNNAHIAMNVSKYITDNNLTTMNMIITSMNPFGIRSYLITDSKRPGYSIIKHEPFTNAVKYYAYNTRKHDNENNHWFYIPSNHDFGTCREQSEKSSLRDKIKLIMPHTCSNRVWRDSIILNRNEYCVDDAICIGFNDESEAKNCQSYMQTRFFRFMMELATPAGSQDAFRTVYQLIPNMNDSDGINNASMKGAHAVLNPRTGKYGYDSDWTDEDLFMLLTYNPVKQAYENGSTHDDALEHAYISIEDWKHIIKITKQIDNKGEQMLSNHIITANYEIANHITELAHELNELFT